MIVTHLEPVHFTVDPTFASYFSRLRQVFLYINDQCNLACKQCIYKPHVTYHEHREIPLPTALGLLRVFHDLGARKVTLLGGEPTLYGSPDRHLPLRYLIEGAHRVGYEYCRLDTNGQFSAGLFSSGGLNSLDEIAFSVDGFDPATNDLLRGPGTFARACARIRQAVQLGLRVSITCCIHKQLVFRRTDGCYGVEHVIRLAERLGIAVVNFHDLFKAGVPMDTWTGSFDTTVKEHLDMYHEIRSRIEDGAYAVAVRLPQCFVSRNEFQRNPEYYGYCPVKLAERVMVHSDGVIRICSNLICSSFGVGRFEGSDIRWDNSPSNETIKHDLTALTPCTNRSKNRSYGEYVPLCFSFKPNQDEVVWRDALQWDQRRTVELLPDDRNFVEEPPSRPRLAVVR